MTLGERIVHYRKRQGLSQEQLSQRLGVSRQSVSKWERDESLPEADKLPLLAKTLGVSLDALLSGEEEAPPQPAGPTPAKGGAVGKLAWLFRRWGWVGGLVLAAYGAFAFGLGLLARFLMGPMFPPRELLLQAGGPVRAAALGFQIITVAVLVVGGLAVVGGIIAAAVLYRRRPKGQP